MYPLVDADSTHDNEDVYGENNDLTRLQSELAAVQQRLEDMGRDNDTFIASFTHDLKNPLTTIMGRIELLKRVSARPAITPADITRHIEPLDAAVNRLAALIQNFGNSTRDAEQDDA